LAVVMVVTTVMVMMKRRRKMMTMMTTKKVIYKSPRLQDPSPECISFYWYKDNSGTEVAL